jgi:hypothetical protein
MTKLRMRSAGVVMALAVVSALVFMGEGTVSASTNASYFCQGTTDLIGSTAAGGLYTTKGLMGQLQAYAGINQYPEPDVAIALDAPALVAPNETYTANFQIDLAVPTALAETAQTYFGLTEVDVRNTWFEWNSSNTAPGFTHVDVPDQTVDITTGQISSLGGGELKATGASGTFVGYTPGASHIELHFDPAVYVASIQGVPIFLTLSKLIFDCSPRDFTHIGTTSINDIGGTTTTGGPTTSQAPTTTAAPTTTGAPTTTAAPTTTTEAPTTSTAPTTTVAPTTSTAPTTTQAPSTTSTTTEPSTTTAAPTTTSTTTTAPPTTVVPTTSQAPTTAPATTTTVAPTAGDDSTTTTAAPTTVAPTTAGPTTTLALPSTTTAPGQPPATVAGTSASSGSGSSSTPSSSGSSSSASSAPLAFTGADSAVLNAVGVLLVLLGALMWGAARTQIRPRRRG